MRLVLLPVAILASLSTAQASRLDFGPWRVLYDSTIFYSLQWHGEVLLDAPYSWLPIVTGRAEVTQDDEQALLRWTDIEPQLHPQYESDLRLQLGPGNSCVMAWRIRAHQTNTRELAVFIPDAFIRERGQTVTLDYVMRDGATAQAQLTNEEFKPLWGVQSLAFSGGRHPLTIEATHDADKGYGWSFQDYRASQIGAGCWRLVWSYGGEPIEADLTVQFSLPETEQATDG